MQNRLAVCKLAKVYALYQNATHNRKNQIDTIEVVSIFLLKHLLLVDLKSLLAYNINIY